MHTTAYMDNNDALSVPVPHNAGHVGKAPPVVTVFSLAAAIPTVSALKNGPLDRKLKCKPVISGG